MFKNIKKEKETKTNGQIEQGQQKGSVDKAATGTWQKNIS